MKESMPCDVIFWLYKKVLDMHILTKWTDEQFHKASQAIYEALFEVYHKAMEGMADAGIKPGMKWEEARKKTYEAVSEAKMIIERMVDQNKDVAVDNILRGQVEEIGFQLGTAKSLLLGEVPKEWEPGIGWPAKEETEDYVKTMGVEK